VLTRFSTAFQKSGGVPDFFYFSKATCYAPDRPHLLTAEQLFLIGSSLTK
jgi:hypothetical protein